MTEIPSELATLYLDAPTVRHDQDASALYAAVDRSGLWSAMPRHQSLVIGCREYLLRVTADAQGRLRYRPVPPDMVVATSAVAQPDVPDRLAELRCMDGRWVWEVLDISDPETPSYRVILAGRSGGFDGDDISAQVLGADLVGDAYPYRKADGTPVLPYVVYHAERRGDRLFDPYEGRELVEGSLNLGVLNSFWLHCVKDASWPQRYVIGARPAGLESVDEGGRVVRQEVVTDPGSLLVLEAVETVAGTVATPSAGQFEAGSDPASLLEAVQSYASALATDAGVSPSDIQRVETGGQSGYAIALNESGKRQAQKRFAPHFRYADEQLMALSAILLNRATGSDLPEDGYTVAYASIPLSPEELRAQREHVLALMERDLMSPVDAYLVLHPGLTRTQATQELARIAAEKAALTKLALITDDNTTEENANG